MAEPQRKFPLSAKLQMEDLPMEMLAGDALLTQSAAKEKGFCWGSSCSFSQKNTAEKVAKDLKGSILVEGPYGRAQNEASKGGLDFQLVVVAGSLHIDFECDLTLH